jgi:hypothetical protein
VNENCENDLKRDSVSNAITTQLQYPKRLKIVPTTSKLCPRAEHSSRGNSTILNKTFPRNKLCKDLVRQVGEIDPEREWIQGHAEWVKSEGARVDLQKRKNAVKEKVKPKKFKEVLKTRVDLE